MRIHPDYRSVADIHAAISALAPEGEWELEWLVKAGEGGTWQATWDPYHRLSVSGPSKLAYLKAAGMNLPLLVTAYVVVRGRPEWNEAEWRQVAECAAECDRTVLNLEPGPGYWDGPTDPGQLWDEYLLPLQDRLRRDAPKAKLELCTIPQQWAIDKLGGVACLHRWLSICHSASWECYDLAASDLDVAKSMARVDAWLGEDTPWEASRYRIPVVQRSRVGAWAATDHAGPGLQVWHLDGDL